MEDSLVEQLKGHLKNYHRMRELKKLQEEEDQEPKHNLKKPKVEVLEEGISFNERVLRALELTSGQA